MHLANYQRSFVLLSTILMVLFLGCSREETAVIPDQINFNEHVRPILSGNCFACHGPDAEAREAGLRLDTREGATATLESGKRAIVPGRPASSELMKRIGSQDWDVMMPPPEAKKTLTGREIAILKKWVRQGAEWEEHWAFIPPVAPKVPNLKGIGDHVVDQFVAKDLRDQGIEPLGKADKQTLLRRLSFILTGLPPTEQLRERFLTDDAPDAYEKLVDELLASPRFGERWARHWMDLVRYSETRGHEFDYPVNGAWHYRDYLIRAFNEDLPYSQFVSEQLAGDLLPEPRLNPQSGFNESVLGTAFYVLGEGKHSPVDIKEEEVDRIENMIDVTTKTFQAMTVACARCHDHKFDPIPTRDYYALYGIMESSRWAIHPVRSEILAANRMDSIRHLKEELKQWIGSVNGVDPGQAQASPVHLPEPEAGETVLENMRVISDFRDGGLHGWKVQGAGFANVMGMPVLKDGRLEALETGKASSLAVGKGLITAIRSPTLTITEDSILVRVSGRGSVFRIVIDNFQLIQDPIYGELEEKLDYDEMRDYRIDLSPWKGHKYYLEVATGKFDRHQFGIDPGAWAAIELAVTYNAGGLDRQFLRHRPASGKVAKRQLLRKWMLNKASAEEVAALNRMISTGELRASGTGIREAEQRWNDLDAKLFDSAYFRGMERGDHIESPVFVRGNHTMLSPGKEPHHFLTAVPLPVTYEPETSSRLSLAASILHPDNPLTARVMVNRIWHYLFGRGIVETVDNFGFQGKPPTHPELLDFLAIKFRDDGWSVKSMIRYIVLSKTFQRTSIGTREIFEVDPQNLLLSHYPIHRLEAEAIRDAVLATSGRMDTIMYGFPVYVHLTEFVKGRGRPPSGPVDGAGRRSIYQSVRRNFLSPFMLTFDLPVPFSTFGKRNITNVPAQSLALMNDPFVQEQAGAWAERLLQKGSGAEDRIRLAYLTAFTRPPTEEEVTASLNFLQEQAATYAFSELEMIDNPAVWADFCHSIFNMKEFIYVR